MPARLSVEDLVPGWPAKVPATMITGSRAGVASAPPAPNGTPTTMVSNAASAARTPRTRMPAKYSLARRPLR